MKSGPYTVSFTYPKPYDVHTGRLYNSQSKTWATMFAEAIPGMNVSQVKSGSYNPQWKRDRGKRAVNSAYSLETYKYETVNVATGLEGYKPRTWYVNGVFTQGTDVHTITGALRPTNGWFQGTEFALNLSSADNRAKLSLFSNIRDEYQKFQAGTVLWELRETIKMVRKPGAALWKGIEKYLIEAPKRVSKVKLKKSLKSYDYEIRLAQEKRRVLRDTWLEMSFGWSPLISDIKDISEAAAELGMRAEKEYEGIRSIRSKRVQADESSGKYLVDRNACYTSGWSLPYKELTYRTEKAWVMYTAQCDRKLLYPKDELKALSTLSGFSVRDFIPTLWNCIPYSFLVDYFVNINDVLEFYSTDKSSMVACTKTVKRDILVKSQFIPTVNDTFLYYKWTKRELGSHTMSRMSFVRSIVDIVTLDVKFELSNPLPKPKKLLNMAALSHAFWTAKLSLAR